MAIWRRGKPDALLHHSDRGSQYTSEQFQLLMADNGVICSMSRSGNVWDNAAMESFFSSLKTERTGATDILRTARQLPCNWLPRQYLTGRSWDSDVEGPSDRVATHRACRLRGGTCKAADDGWPERYSEGVLPYLFPRGRVRRLQGVRRSFHSPGDEIGPAWAYRPWSPIFRRGNPTPERSSGVVLTPISSNTLWARGVVIVGAAGDEHEIIGFFVLTVDTGVTTTVPSLEGINVVHVPDKIEGLRAC
jgi:hypothetical protein